MKTLCIWMLYINILCIRWCAYACEAPLEQKLQAFCPDNLCPYQPTFYNVTACLPMSLKCFSDVIFTGFRLKQSINGNMPGLQIQPQHGYTLPNFIASTMQKREFPVSWKWLWTVSHLWVPSKDLTSHFRSSPLLEHYIVVQHLWGLKFIFLVLCMCACVCACGTCVLWC